MFAESLFGFQQPEVCRWFTGFVLLGVRGDGSGGVQAVVLQHFLFLPAVMRTHTELFKNSILKLFVALGGGRAYLAISSLSCRYSAFLASGRASGVLTGLFSFSEPVAGLGLDAWDRDGQKDR